MPRKIFSDSRLPRPSMQDRWPPVTPTRSRRRDHPAVTATFLALAIVCVVALLGWGHQVDAQAQEDDQTTAYARETAIYQRGYAEGKSAALETVGAAYAAGQADALESVQGTPQGVALAQACLAHGALAAVRGATNVHGVAK